LCPVFDPPFVIAEIVTMVDVLTQIEIKCPKAKVAEYASDPNHAPEWYVNIKSADCTPVMQGGKTINKNVTLMTLRNPGEPKGFSKVVAPFMSLAMRRANHKDLSRLKQILEK
jgi:hypothetical protein